MGKYILKRLGYMVVVALILSLLMFLVYTMIPYDRAVVEIDAYKASLKNNPNAATSLARTKTFLCATLAG